MNALLLVSALALAEPAARPITSTSRQLGKVTFQTSCSPQAHAIFTRAACAGCIRSNIEQAESSVQRSRRGRSRLRHRPLGRGDEPYHPLWAPPTKAELERGTRGRREGRGGAGEERARARLCRRDRDLLPRFRQARSQDPGARLQRGHGGRCTSATPPTAKPRSSTRCRRSPPGRIDKDPNFVAREGCRGDPQRRAQGRAGPSGRRPLSDPQLRLSAARRARRPGGQALREHRAGLAARAAHAFAHLHPARHVGRIRSRPT